MALLRRRRRAPSQGAADPTLEAVGTRVLDAAEEALGTRPSLVTAPAALPAGAGPDAYTVEVAADDPAWTGTLVVRTSPPTVLEAELSWMQAAAERGFAVPEVLSEDAEYGLVVLRPPAGDNLANRMTSDLMALPSLLAGLGRLHAQLHALPTEGLATCADDTDDVICHGELHPGHVYLDGDEVVGGVVANWTGARLAEPAYDVGSTLAFFWSSPLFVDNLAQRQVLKLARDSLASAYLAAYRAAAVRELDDERLAHWQAHHLELLADELERFQREGATGPWDRASSVYRADKALDELRDRRSELLSSGVV